MLRNYRLILATAATLVAAGIAYALVKPPLYMFTTVIEVGSHLVTEQDREIEKQLESTDAVMIRVTQAYIPAALAEISKQAPGRAINARAVSAAMRGSPLVTLTTLGPQADFDFHKDLHRMVFERLHADHARSVGQIKRNRETLIKLSEYEIAQLKDETTKLRERARLFDDLGKLLNDQVRDFRGFVKDLEGLRDDVVRLAGSEAVRDGARGTSALPLLIIGQNQQNDRLRIATIEEKLAYTLPKERSELEVQISEKLRVLSRAEALRAKAQADLNELRDTKVLGATMPSLRPVGLHGIWAVGVFGIIGLILGVLAAFVWTVSKRRSVNNP